MASVRAGELAERELPRTNILRFFTKYFNSLITAGLCKAQCMFNFDATEQIMLPGGVRPLWSHPRSS
jgi:hypothetical protein